ncbi:MAG: M13 family metallopeptidase [Lachnospiraceae bacterium]|nr:M13 family metallopeptidase [Lachnospiraceae bacterium]
MNRRYNKILAILLTMALAFNIAGCRMQGGPQTAGTQESAQADTGDEGSVPGEGGYEDSQGPDDTPGEADAALITTEPASWMNSDIQEWVRESEPPRLVDDFHHYVNRNWMLNTKIPDGYSSYDPITERSLEVDAQLLEILKNPEKETDPELIHDQELVQKYYRMWLDWQARDEVGMDALKELLDPLMKAQTLDDLTAYLSMPRTVISATELAQCDTYIDWNNADYYAVYVEPIDLIFGDSMYYEEMEESDAMAEPYYDRVIRHILVGMGYTDEEATNILKGCFAFEKDISAYIMTTEEENERDAIVKENNPRTLEQLEAEAGDFPIRKILEAHGVENSNVYILTQPEWLKAMDVLYEESYMENLKDYLICYTVQDYATLLDRETFDLYYEVINGISGAVGTKSDEKFAADAVDQFLPSQLGRLYSDKYVTDETKEEVTEITKEILDEYKVMLNEETFLSEETRKEAINKLDNLALHIAKPDKWEDYSGLDFKGSEEGGNLISAQDEVGAFWVKKMQEQVNQKVDRDLWTSKTQQVNAFYSPVQNTITICSGILGGSLYSPDMSREELFANVGDTLAHEISHAFDTTGCQFDEKGNLRNWWTEQDQAAFTKRADKLAAYYDNIEPFQDVFCVGSQIEGEAIADLVAIKILLRIAAKDPKFDYDKFFRAYSETWRTITTARSEYYALSQDSHPLPYLRVNAVVQQFDEFYKTYGVKEGDGMYLAPEDRLEVW